MVNNITNRLAEIRSNAEFKLYYEMIPYTNNIENILMNTNKTIETITTQNNTVKYIRKKRSLKIPVYFLHLRNLKIAVS